MITRTHASSVGVPATQTIAVKVREGANSTRNKLIQILEKGTSLPTKGSQRFRADHGLNTGEKEEFLDFDIYQDEGTPEPELNLRIGVLESRETTLSMTCGFVKVTRSYSIGK